MIKNSPIIQNKKEDKIEFKKESNFDEKLLDLRRVTRVVAGGKRFSFRATLVVGDKKGNVGIGIAKGKDVSEAIAKAKVKAEKKMIKVPIINDTIPHEVQAKYCAAKVILKPAAKGHGIVAGGSVRAVCELAGIKDLSAKILSRTPNKLSNAMATITALSMIKPIALKEINSKEVNSINKIETQKSENSENEK